MVGSQETSVSFSMWLHEYVFGIPCGPTKAMITDDGKEALALLSSVTEKHNRTMRKKLNGK